MSTFDVSNKAGAGDTMYGPASPFASRSCDVDLAEYPLGASGADTVKVMPLAAGEVVSSVFLKILEPVDTGVTLKADDGRTGGGALVAASSADADAGTFYAGSGAKVGAAINAAGYLTLTTAAAVATTQGRVRVYAIIAKAF